MTSCDAVVNNTVMDETIAAQLPSGCSVKTARVREIGSAPKGEVVAEGTKTMHSAEAVESPRSCETRRSCGTPRTRRRHAFASHRLRLEQKSSKRTKEPGRLKRSQKRQKERKRNRTQTTESP